MSIYVPSVLPLVLSNAEGGVGMDEVPLLQGEIGGSSFVRTCSNGLNAMLGIGILSVPYALSGGGWLSLGLLFLVATICCYTGILLLRCMNASSEIRSYPDIGEYAFGRKGRIVVSMFLYLELYLVAIEFLILEGDNLDKLLPGAGPDIGITKIQRKKLFAIIASLVILPSTWLKNLRALALVSAGGVIASLILVVLVIWVGVCEDVGFQERGTLIDLGGWPTALGLYTFCYSGHSVIPTLFNSMENKRHFSKVVYICFIFCTLIYAAMAVIGYLMFGDKIQSQITLNMPRERIATYIAIGVTLMSPLTKYALLVTPIFTAIEEQLLPRDDTSFSGIIIIRTLIVTSTVVIAVSIPFFSYVMAFIGSFTAAAVSLLFPCICYLKIFRATKRSIWENVAIILTLITGALVAVLGTCSSVKQIIQALLGN